ncbi:hypothetical protein BGZ51_002458 [Haplosporangium sp. Z 767]|nr:hypothetical protein BGZ51_002458 [Haplosporangium sp. Z 767]
MLNVLIALINKAFIDGDETWRLVWLENRLRVIESVENLTFHIPGFREHYNWFPEEIYYTATAREIEDYQAKYFANDLRSGAKKNKSSEPVTAILESHSTKQVAPEAVAATAAATVEKSMQELREQLKEQMQTQMVALQGQVQASVEKKVATLQEQNMMLQEQNTLLQEQMKALHSMLSTLVGDRYNSIEDELDSENWPFQTMMIVFFFFTVILKLNVFIGFREHFNYFPGDFYYSTTVKEIEDY